MKPQLSSSNSAANLNVLYTSWLAAPRYIPSDDPAPLQSARLLLDVVQLVTWIVVSGHSRCFPDISSFPGPFCFIGFVLTANI
jgi:hypothetical protein